MKPSSLHQIEITSRCNLRCRYCVHPTMARPKLDMTDEIFTAALAWAQRFVQAGTQKELNLAGIGESTMHPEFVAYVGRARYAVGWDTKLVITTNGLLVTRDLARALAPLKPVVFVSLHRPEKAGPAVEALKEYGILSGVSVDPAMAAIDWAGQVKWHTSANERTGCQWLGLGMLFCAADGTVLRCCLDGRSGGEGVVGTIFDADLDKKAIVPYDLCHSCSYFRPEAL